MVFLFDCDNDEILLPRAYDLIDDARAFIDLMRKTEVKDVGVEDGKAALKIVLENMLKKHPAETSAFLKRFWILDNGEKAPNALKTIITLLTSEGANDFFTSVVPFLATFSKNVSAE